MYPFSIYVVSYFIASVTPLFSLYALLVGRVANLLLTFLYN